MALKDMPQAFDVDSEEDIRIAVVKYFHELGFELDEIRAETRFTIQLGHNELPIGGQKISQRDQVTGRSDLLLTRHGRPLAIVETKAPGHALNEKDALQALSYARLLLEMAPFAVVTNGRETRVYDTFASTPTTLETSIDSVWAKHGQYPPSIGEDIRLEAAKTLIGVNPRTLQLFCQKQVARAMEDIKGGPREGKIYIPEVYVPRHGLKKAFDDWLATDTPCFAVVAESGLGKTNLLCATAEELATDSYVLFYSALRLAGSLQDAICNDFVWEFHRERGLAHIVDRFAAIARESNRQFLIFVDGLEEFPGNQRQFKNELLDLVSRLRGSSIRLCLSCKAFDWESFVLEHGRSYNRLATSVCSPHSPEGDPSFQSGQAPRSRSVGVWLELYTDEELDETFVRYKDVYSLQGTLRETTRDECRYPLTLRLLAEVWSGRHRELPPIISQREVFDEYWAMHMHKVQQPLVAERWLATLARLTVESGERQIVQSTLLAQLYPGDAQDAAYQELVRIGLLRVTRDSEGYPMISFGLQQLQSYVYTLKAQAWPQRAPQEVAKAICDLLNHPVGFETVEFYLRVIDRGETHLLTDVGLHDIRCFVRLMEAINLKSSVLTSSSPDEQERTLHAHLEQYILAYSELSRSYFLEQCEKLEPYTTGEVGLWVSGSWYQLRTRTPSYPQSVIVLPQEIAQALWNRTAPPEVYTDLPPGGTIHLDLGMSTLIDQFPQKMAWKGVLSQIARLFVNRCLDETRTPELLREHIWHLLQKQPFSTEEVPVLRKYWQVLGLQQIEDIQTMPLQELLERTRARLEQDKDQLVQIVQRRSAELQTGVEPTWARWYRLHIWTLRRLYYALDALYSQRHSLTLPQITTLNLFEYLRTGDLTPTVQGLEKLLPSIFNAYTSLVSQNFSRLAERLAFYRYAGASVLVELTHEPAPPGMRNDLLRIAYVLLPSVQLPTRYLVYTCEEEDSVAHVQFVDRTLQGWWTERSGSQGARFGKAALSRKIGDVYIHEPEAYFCFTQFPSHYPVLDQVYQLLGNEIQSLLEGDFKDWYEVRFGRIEKDQLD
jgi:hypothetical protein